MTFTVLARDGRTGLIGAATASKSLAVGNAVIEVRPGVGAAASQAWTNRALRGHLLDAVASGSAAADAVALIPRWDDEPALRQAAVLPSTGPGAAHTGADTSPWSGHLVESDLIVAGNLLTSEDVLTAIRDAWTADDDGGLESSPDAARFAARLVAALAAGEARGGDRRGRQSAAVVVTSSGDAGDAWVDLRVDDHRDPLTELRRLVELRASDLRADLSARRV